MRHFLGFVALVFSIMFLIYVYRDDVPQSGKGSVLKVYAPSSFISDWGPGPEIKKIFEEQTGQKVIFIEMADPAMTFQKMNTSSSDFMGDVVVGLDQYDLMRSVDKVIWKELTVPTIKNNQLNLKAMEASPQFKNFVPYDWAAIAFVKRKDHDVSLTSLKDLFKPELKGKIALQDPRTSSPGLQFLMWVVNTMPEDQAIDFLKRIAKQSHSFSSSWSTSYGLFKNKNADLVLSYNTSPAYHILEEKDDGYQSLEFTEKHPVQVEFAGVLGSCLNCESAIKFVYFLRSTEIQKIIMNKNYMLPIDKQAMEGTIFDALPVYNLLDLKWSTQDEMNKWLNLWSDIIKDAS